MRIHLSPYDLPENFEPSERVAVDTEAMGLCYRRDRLCLVQVSNGDNEVYLVHFPTPDYTRSPRLVEMLKASHIRKIFHFARFDVGILQYSFNIHLQNIFCTKIASHLTRTFTNKHGLKDLCKELLGVEVSKNEQTSDWGSPTLNDAQKKYAAADVVYLHRLHNIFEELLAREGRKELAEACFQFLPFRAELDILGGENFDVLSYKAEGL